MNINSIIAKKKKFLKEIHTPEVIQCIKNYEATLLESLFKAKEHIHELLETNSEDESNLILEKENIEKEIKTWTIL